MASSFSSSISEGLGAWRAGEAMRRRGPPSRVGEGVLEGEWEKACSKDRDEECVKDLLGDGECSAWKMGKSDGLSRS